MCFRNYRLLKTSSHHSVRKAVFEHAYVVDMWKCPEYLRNPHESAIFMFFEQYEGSWFGKYFP